MTRVITLLLVLSASAPGHRPGAWVTYRLSRPGSPPAFWKLTLLGEGATSNDGRVHWVELAWGPYASLEAPLARARLLLSGAGQVVKAQASVGMGPFQELPPDRLKSLLWQSERRRPLAPWGRASAAAQSARLMTREGTLNTRRVELSLEGEPVERLWLCDAVPILGLAKAELPGILLLELEGWGEGAQTDGGVEAPARVEPLGLAWVLP